MPNHQRNEQTLRERIQLHLTTLKIPVTAEQVDEILSNAGKTQPAYLEFFESVPDEQRDWTWPG